MEPDPNTSVLQEINNSFYSCTQDLRIWSFYENSTDPVVDRRRGTLGKQQYTLRKEDLKTHL